MNFFIFFPFFLKRSWDLMGKTAGKSGRKLFTAPDGTKKSGEMLPCPSERILSQSPRFVNTSEIFCRFSDKKRDFDTFSAIASAGLPSFFQKTKKALDKSFFRCYNLHR
ncbi:MAG: hypothetical protein IJV00_06920 [Clostridia bacterium]|nr:hypothetical protein [Clostridia bacterium]